VPLRVGNIEKGEQQQQKELVDVFVHIVAFVVEQ
jgi:hypothetical protein